MHFLLPLLDHALLGGIGLLLRPRYLRQSTGLPTEALAERLERWKNTACEIRPAGPAAARQRHDVIVRVDDESFSTACYLDRPSDDAENLIVYHHGLAEPPLDGSYSVLFPDDHATRALKADRLALVALCHDRPRAGLRRLLGTLEGFEQLMACGVAAAKHAADMWAGRYRRMVYVGLSVGGIIGLAETIHEPRFAANVCLVSTPFLADLLLRSSLTHLVDRRFRSLPYDGLRPRVDFEAMVNTTAARVVMINGRQDTMMNIEPLRSWWRSRPEIETHEIDCSHLSIVVSARRLRRELFDVLGRVLAVPRPASAGISRSRAD